MTRMVKPECHEFAANLNFSDSGLMPWFAALSQINEVDGGTTLEAVPIDAIDPDRESNLECDVSIRYQEGNLVPPEDNETPAGTEVEFETIREPRIHVESRDEHNLRSVDYHMRPRWDDQKGRTRDGELVSINSGGLADHRTDAVSIRAAGSNVDFAMYDDILREAAYALGIAGHYFEDVHKTSNIQDAARYVRGHESEFSRIHARSGPIVGLAHVLEDDRDGYRKLVQNDSDERNVKKPGMYHTVTLGPERVRAVWPDHQLPVEIKHYYKKDYHDRTDGLRHPKLEAAFQTSRTDETLRYDAETIEQVKQELDECIYSVLTDADISLRGGESSPFVADEIFTAENAETEASVVSLDLTQIEHEQHSIVCKHLFGEDGLSPVERESLGMLVTDGGEVSPDDIAEAYDRHIDAVYRALGRMEDLIEREYGSVSLKSTYVAELVNDAIQQAEEAVSRAVDATASAIDAADRGLDERTSAFLAWADINDITWRDEGNEVTVNIGDIEAETVQEARREVRQLLREGFDLWTDMNRDPMAFRSGMHNARALVPTKDAKLRSTDSDDRRPIHIGDGNFRVLTGD